MNRPPAGTVPPPPRPTPRLIRGAAWLFDRGRSFPVHQFRKRALRKAYLSGWANPARNLPDEEPDPAIIETGRVLQERVLAVNAGKHRESAFRVLMFRPRSITAEIWFGGLSTCMRHAGIDCQVMPPGSTAAEINACIDAFAPNVLVATESMATLRALDLRFIRDYKRHRGCLRLFVPVGMPGARVRRHDDWRRSLRVRGLTVDAYFSIFEREFYEHFGRDEAGPSIDYVAVPQACNPFVDRPLPERRRYDYFMATSLTNDRLAVTCRFLRPIFARNRGLWAGRGWGFGEEYVPPAEMPRRYAQTRVALSPLAGFVPLYAAELTHRVYAAAGCGTFQLTTPTAITRRYFEPDELVQGETPEEYARLFEHYVDRPAERNAVALRALRRVYSDHTCFNRIDRLVDHWDDWRRRGFF